jgi:hypothetical protein
VKLVDRVRRETGGNPALMEIALADEQGSLSGAVAGRLAALSSAAQSVFSAIVTSGLPVEEGDLEQKLELFETDEALRSLAAQRLVRLRRTGNLSEIAPYHDRLRTLPSVRKVKAPSAR